MLGHFRKGNNGLHRRRDLSGQLDQSLPLITLKLSRAPEDQSSNKALSDHQGNTCPQAGGRFQPSMRNLRPQFTLTVDHDG